jgi:hypothetical protein
VSATPQPQRDAQAAVGWRRAELIQCGFPRALGCSPELAVRILSPREKQDAEATVSTD